jgi:hypothetical protein
MNGAVGIQPSASRPRSGRSRPSAPEYPAARSGRRRAQFCRMSGVASNPWSRQREFSRALAPLGSTPGNREVRCRLGLGRYSGNLRRLEKKRQRERARLSHALITYLLHLDGYGNATQSGPLSRIGFTVAWGATHLCMKVEKRQRAERSGVVGPGRFAPGRAAQWPGWARSVCGPRGFFLLLIMHGGPARKPILTVRPQLPRRCLLIGALRRSRLSQDPFPPNGNRGVSGDNGYRNSENLKFDCIRLTICHLFRL